MAVDAALNCRCIVAHWSDGGRVERIVAFGGDSALDLSGAGFSKVTVRWVDDAPCTGWQWVAPPTYRASCSITSVSPADWVESLRKSGLLVP
jgi:hypothetical protein